MIVECFDAGYLKSRVGTLMPAVGLGSAAPVAASQAEFTE